VLPLIANLSNTCLITALRDKLGIGFPGVLTYGEINEVFNKILELIEL
jgi:hypothetical protein